MENAETTMGQALLRGACGRCPSCGKGHMFRSYLKVADRCANCGQELHHHRADDLPAYLVMSIVGHVVVGAMLWAELRYAPSYTVHAALWGPLTLILTFGLLQPIKGAIVALQWKLGMHGFGMAMKKRVATGDVAQAAH